MLGFRPESASLAAKGEPDTFRLYVENVENLGSDGYIYGWIMEKGASSDAVAGRATMSDQNTLTTVRVLPSELPAVGDVVTIHVDPANMHLFAPSTGLRIN